MPGPFIKLWGRRVLLLIPVVVLSWLALHWRPSDTGLPGPMSYTQSAGYGTPGFRAGSKPIFTLQFPQGQRLQGDLNYARVSGRLKPKNEALIQRAVLATSDRFNMPPAVLWCLLFQESRLNHLEGITDSSGSRGLGQFSSFSFFEVNHHLDRFFPSSSQIWMQLLGKDVRPVMPRPDNLSDPSSYFYIPTAVISSATYLNNRYHHLRKLAANKGITYDPQVLWLHAALAYNKGTRSVLATWKETRRYRKSIGTKLWTNPRIFHAQVVQTDLLPRALQRIWSRSKAQSYAREAGRHVATISECAIQDGGKPQ